MEGGLERSSKRGGRTGYEYETCVCFFIGEVVGASAGETMNHKACDQLPFGQRTGLYEAETGERRVSRWESLDGDFKVCFLVKFWPTDIFIHHMPFLPRNFLVSPPVRFGTLYDGGGKPQHAPL